MCGFPLIDQMIMFTFLQNGERMLNKNTEISVRRIKA